MGRSISARATRSRKARNLSANPNIVVRLKSGDDIVILEGIAEEVAAPDRRSSPRSPTPFLPDSAEGMYALRPRVAFAWLARDFPRTATRWILAEANSSRGR